MNELMHVKKSTRSIKATSPTSTISTTAMTAMTPLLCATILLTGCGAMGWGDKSSGSTHTMTGGAEAAPTAEATPQPARPRGNPQHMPPASPQRDIPPGSSGGASGSGTTERGNATTGGAEAVPTDQGTPSAR